MAKQTDRQRRFVEEYCVDFNATAAAKRAGYSERTASEMGYENLRKPQIREAIDKRLAELSMSAAEATKRLTDWGRGTVDPFLDVTHDGQMRIDLGSDRARSALHLLKKVKQTERLVPSGEDDAFAVERKTEIELHDAKDAVIQLAKILGLYIEKHEHTGKDGGPVQLAVIGPGGAPPPLPPGLADAARARISAEVQGGGDE